MCAGSSPKSPRFRQKVCSRFLQKVGESERRSEFADRILHRLGLRRPFVIAWEFSIESSSWIGLLATSNVAEFTGHSRPPQMHTRLLPIEHCERAGENRLKRGIHTPGRQPRMCKIDQSGDSGVIR